MFFDMKCHFSEQMTICASNNVKSITHNPNKCIFSANDFFPISYQKVHKICFFKGLKNLTEFVFFVDEHTAKGSELVHC